MKHRHTLFATLSILLLVGFHALAQESGAPVAVEVPSMQTGGFFSIMAGGGPLGLLTWAAIFVWAIALLPLGVLSIVHCQALTSKRWPLATKLLLFGPVFLLVLGWIGVIQGLIAMFATLAFGAPDVGLFALNISQAFYSLASTLFLMQFYLFFFLVSFVIVHVKHRQLDKTS